MSFGIDSHLKDLENELEKLEFCVKLINAGDGVHNYVPPTPTLNFDKLREPNTHVDLCLC